MNLIGMIMPLVLDEGSLSALVRDGKSLLDDRMKTLWLVGEGPYYIHVHPVIFFQEKEEKALLSR